MTQLFTFEKLYFTTGGVRTLIALHHGRKMKSESLASCRCRVNIYGGSEIAWINVECNGDSLFAVLRDSCYSSVTNLLLEGNWRDSERIETAALPKNLFIRLAAVTLTADGRVNNIIFANYLAGNRPLICKRITVAATFQYTSYFSCHTLKGVNTGFAKEEALRLPRPIRHVQRLIKTYRVSYMLKE